jgi:hypothetical protein
VLTFLVIALVMAVASVLIGRSWLLIFAVCVWPVFFVGLLAGWWGSGVGDGWPYALVGLILVSVVGVLLGLLVRQLLGQAGWSGLGIGRRRES